MVPRPLLLIIAFVFTLLFSFSAMRAQATPSVLGFNDLLGLAIQRNGNFLALKLRVREAEGMIRQAQLRPVHAIAIESATGRPLGAAGEEEFAAAYSVPIETFGKRDKRIRIAEKSIDLAQSGIAEGLRTLTFELTSRYVDAIADREKVKAIEQLLAANREHYNLLEARVERGDAPPLELQLFAAELTRAEAQRTLFAGRAAAAVAEIKRVVGLDPAESLVLSEQAFIRAGQQHSFVELQSRALRERADLREARALEEQATAQISLAQVEARPDLTFSIRYSQRNSRFDALGLSATGLPVPLRDRDNILSLGISLPLSSGRRSQGSVQIAAARLEAARLRRQYLETAIPSEVEAAFSRWVASRKAAEVYGQAVEQSDRNLQVVRTAYNLGQLRLFDVLNEQRRLIEAKLAQVDAGVEQARSLAELEQAVGGAVQ